MQFEIDRTSKVAPFEQLKQQVIAGVGDGSLLAGTRLPTVRGLAEQLGMGASAVARAYRELERDGFVETRSRAGTVVKASTDAAAATVQRAAHDYLSRARELGVPAKDAVEYVRRAAESAG